MSQEYRFQTNVKKEAQINALLSDAPFALKEFASSIKSGARETSTRLAYFRDITEFLKYELSVIPGLKDTELSEFPTEILDGLTISDLEEYRNYLHDVRLSGNSAIKRKLSALSVFFKFLSVRDYITKNPMADFDVPQTNRHRIIRLDSEECNQLLEGILQNDRYENTFINCGGDHYRSLQVLCNAKKLTMGKVTEYADAHHMTRMNAAGKLLKTDVYEDSEIIDIPDDIRASRERMVLRNYAIVKLFLGSGLRVSELVGLDLDDIDWKKGSLTIIAKGGDETEVYFGEAVKAALMDYVNTGANAPRPGRAGFGPVRTEKAVFLSSRGTRMSVRSVELMVKEMVKTYLPDCRDKDIFSPHKLRATCATRILTQTGDISLASEQLNHKGVAVTAAFYAELKKERRKELIQKLDMEEW